MDINSDWSITLLDKTKEIVIVNKDVCGHFNKIQDISGYKKQLVNYTSR